ncbi:hypothetical protein BAE44_0017608 [Dichanthelium oligosanthes]|uniref:BHLH domain-containing protein n=1 Tax=Dichanthelium oligosanthes TaxID=888268 RepID=A0A1E5V8M3_9POAL|nr:hypothetical protein BAE44_0017608 [Dichanthelium oligosanthes]
MAEEHPLALSLAAKTKGSPAGTTTVASAPPEQRQAMVETERARRRHMSRLYAELGALLPDLPPRAHRARILEEAIAYVGVLQGTVAKLEAHGAFAGAGRRTTADGGGAAGAGTGAAELLAARKASCFAARLPASRRPGALTRVLEVLRRHGVHVLAATVTSNGGEATVTVTTAAVAPTVVEGIKADISSSIA